MLSNLLCELTFSTEGPCFSRPFRLTHRAATTTRLGSSHLVLQTRAHTGASCLLQRQRLQRLRLYYGVSGLTWSTYPMSTWPASSARRVTPRISTLRLRLSSTTGDNFTSASLTLLSSPVAAALGGLSWSLCRLLKMWVFRSSRDGLYCSSNSTLKMRLSGRSFSLLRGRDLLIISVLFLWSRQISRLTPVGRLQSHATSALR